MRKPKKVRTPVGMITIKSNATPSTTTNTTISEVKDEFIKIANSGTVPVERLRDNVNITSSN